MASVKAFAQVKLTASQVSELSKHVTALTSHLQEVKGYIGASVWTMIDRSSRILIATEFSDSSALGEALNHLYSAGVFNSGKSVPKTPPEFKAMMVSQSRGFLLCEGPDEVWMSYSARAAVPGQAADLKRDYEVTFSELSEINGLIGWAYGEDQSAPERIIGLALWNSTSSFQASVPDWSRLELSVYKRIWKS